MTLRDKAQTTVDTDKIGIVQLHPEGIILCVQGVGSPMAAVYEDEQIAIEDYNAIKEAMK